MNPMNRTALTQQYIRMRQELLEAHPDVDEETLADTLEGEQGLQDAIVRLVVGALEDECWSSALADRIDDMRARKQRIDARAGKRRQIAQVLMSESGLRKIEQPDFTASLAKTPQSVIITDEATIPDSYAKYARTIDKTKLRTALMSGEKFVGAVLSNGGQSLTIRTK